MFTLFVETMSVLTELKRFQPINIHPSVVLTAMGASNFPTLTSSASGFVACLLLLGLQLHKYLKIPLPCLHWSMGNLLIGNTIPEAVQEFVIGFALECCFDEIKKLTIFDS